MPKLIWTWIFLAASCFGPVFAAELQPPLTPSTNVTPEPSRGAGCSLRTPKPEAVVNARLVVRNTPRDVGPYRVNLPGYATDLANSSKDSYWPFLIRAKPGNTLRDRSRQSARRSRLRQRRQPAHSRSHRRAPTVFSVQYLGRLHFQLGRPGPPAERAATAIPKSTFRRRFRGRRRPRSSTRIKSFTHRRSPAVSTGSIRTSTARPKTTCSRGSRVSWPSIRRRSTRPPRFAPVRMKSSWFCGISSSACQRGRRLTSFHRMQNYP